MAGKNKAKRTEMWIKLSVGLVLAILLQMYLMSRGSNFWMWFN